MSHQKIIQDLIAWIDEHIDQPLNIDVVAKKSGYSKWYLQRMFRTYRNGPGLCLAADLLPRFPSAV